VRVGLVVDTTVVEIGSTAGFTLVETAAGERVIGRAGAAERWRVSAGADAALQVTAADGRVVGTGRSPLVARPEAGGTVTIAGRNYRGSALVQTASPGRVTAINVVDMEAYLLGVVPHEIGRVGEDLLEAAKAQAVAARTYAVAYLGRRAALGFDVFATVQDQVYGGAGSEHDVTSRAVRETAGEVALFNEQPIQAYYHSTCAGRTAAIEEVWNDRPRPYLVSVSDVNPQTGQAYDHFSNRFRWTQVWTAAEINPILARTLADSLPAGVTSVGELRNMEILERTPSGRVARMRIETTTATFHIGRDRLRWILATPAGAILNSSLLHEIQMRRNAAGRVTELTIHGGGWGHGIGMCQVGAMGRARDGQNYRSILSTYYPGIEIRRLY
jgi:stage II sporulation protein D